MLGRGEGVTLTRRLPCCRRRSVRAAAVIHQALPRGAHSRQQGPVHVGGEAASEARGCSRPEQASCSRQAVSAPAGSSAPKAPSRPSLPRLPTSSGGGSSADRVSGGGARERAEAAADSAIPQPATGAHLCRDKGTALEIFP
ncbi:uncharacterized protein LOC116561117 isoform X2 [Sapajus apella]|uniref:Uncharacterized protein LOC116561117 isoform X2 n=1 Tax=Sapajus apella TaxID=9515 RepID=A0A6J3J1Q8_SAPAP|nr:uncharacterized protein LOC116561117 isoform X2 [Sapajus apella]